jgi:hypothetical protein
MRKTDRLSGWEFWILIGGAAIALLLLVTNIFVSLGNREIQEQVVARQQSLNQGMQVSQLNAQVIRALATLSARTDDAELKNLLSSHGVTFKLNPTGAVSDDTEGGAQ